MMRSHKHKMDYLKISCTVFIIFMILVKDVVSLRVTTTQNPMGLLGNNTLKLVCTYVLELNDIVNVITWQKKQGNTYSNDDNIATFWPPGSPQNASFTQTTPGIEFSNRAELTDPTVSSLTAVLTINEIRCEDEAEYRCVVNYYNPGTGPTSADAATNLTVQARPVEPDGIPVMNPNTNIVENTDVQFTCTGNVGRPAGRFVWEKYKNNDDPDRNPGNVNSSNKSMDGTCTYNATSTLTYRVTRDDDWMVMRCLVESSLAGNVFFRQTAQIRVYYGVTQRPDITRNPSDSAIIAGQTVTLSCSARGHPTPSYTWYDKDNNQVGNSGTYQIQNAQPENSGMYTCMAFNTFTFSNQTFNESASVLINIVLTTPAPTTTTTTVPSTSEGQTNTPTPDPQGGGGGDSGGLPTGALVAIIVVVVLILIVVIAVLIFIFCIKGRRGGRDDIDEPPEKPRNNQDLSFVNRPDIVNNDPNNKFSPFNNQFSNPNKERELAYSDLQFDDRPRSRKPIQLYDPGPNTPYSEVTMPSV